MGPLPSPDKIRVAIIGVGAFGRNHARVYRQLEQQGEVLLAGVLDTSAARAAAVAKEFGTEVLPSIESLRGKVDAASVAVPTADHLGVARSLMESGIDVLIEKPLAPTLAEADELIDVAGRSGRIAQVGHLERFNPAVRATLPLITRPMFFEVHRLSVFTPRSLDIDVVLDLMIHDLDIVLALVKSPVKEVRAVGLPIITPRVDIANVRMEFDSGCVANFTASRVSTERVRKLRFFQPQQYISIDYGRQDVLVFTLDSAGSAVTAGQPTGFSPFPGVTVNRPATTPEEPLLAELRAFVQAVRQRSRPVVPLEDGRRALAVALEVAAAIKEHAHRVM
ncbi:MAG TPA: Gfo/Idh/MocA family oxidoreductase [Terriglobales bacterium]|nr:Gfo/Idh/MocA family oxidoreductase [Terriglobales bacterium]